MAIFSGLAAAVGGLFTAVAASTIGAFALNIAASLGLSAVARKLAGNQVEKPKVQVRTKLDVGASLPQSFIVGKKYATAGQFIYGNTSAGHSPNAVLSLVVTLSDLPVTALTGIWVNGVKRDLIAEGVNEYQAITGYQTSHGQSSDSPGNHLMVHFEDGTQTSAFNFLVSHFGGSTTRPWGANAIGAGTSYAVIYAYISEDFFRNGVPKFIFEMDGTPLYDISKDTTAGGSGAHRWDDKATWESSDSPAVIIYNILRGITYDGEWFYGLQGVTESQLPAAHWIDQINRCKAAVDTADGGTEAKYRAAGEIPVDVDPRQVIRSLLDACNGRLSDAGGVYKLWVADDYAAAMSFTDDDILSTDEQSFTPFFGLSDTVTGISGSYPNPDGAWEMEAAPPLYVADYETKAGGRRLLSSVEYDFVPYEEQVQRLMKGALAEAQRARRHTFAMPPKYFALEPGDWVSWDSARNGYNAKKFRVDGVMVRADASVKVDLTEVDPADYDFDPASEYTEVDAPSVEYQEIASQSVPGFAVSATSIKDASGTDRRPAILAEWDEVDDDVKAIKFQARVKVTGDIVSTSRCDTPADEEDIISEGLLSETTYQVRAQLDVRPARPVEWTEWTDVTTGDYRLTDVDLGISLADKIQKADEAADDLEALTVDFVGTIKAGFDAESATRTGALAALENDLRLEFSTYTSMLSVGDFSNGSGDWTPTQHTIVTSTIPALPPGITHAMEMTNQVLSDGALRADASMGGRVLRMTGWVLTEDATGDAEISIHTLRADGVTSDFTNMTVRTAGALGWSQFTIDSELPADVIQWRPRLRSTVSGATQDIFWAQLSLRDVSGIEGLNTDLAALEANLSSNYYTSLQTDSAIAARELVLNSSISTAETTAKAYADSEILALSSPSGAITAVSNEMAASVTSLRGEIPGFVVTFDSLDVLDVNNGATLAAGEVGQSNVINVVDQGVTRSASGMTNGDVVVRISTAVARQFSGKRVKISMLVRDYGVAHGMALAYSTNDTGNSGVMVKSLTGSWEWVDFFFDVPIASSGSSDYIAIWSGEATGSGNHFHIARMVVQLAAEATDLPEIADLSGEITDIKGLDVDGATAFGTLMSQLAVNAGGTSATITNQGSAIATLDGKASASLVMRAKAGGSVGEVEIVAMDDANGGAAASTVKMTGDVIQFDGIGVFESGFQSGDFNGTISPDGKSIVDFGTAGFAFTENDAVANNIVNRSWLQVGSVSDRQTVFDSAESFSDLTFTEVISSGANVFVCAVDMNVRSGVTSNVTVDLLMRRHRNGAWEGYEIVDSGTVSVVGGFWFSLSFSNTIAVFADKAQFKLSIGTASRRNVVFEAWGVAV